MPTYAYRCPNGHEFDHFVRKMSEAVQTLPCPTDGLPAIRLVSGGAGLVFKGSGFYATDYKRPGNNGGEGSEGKPATDKPATDKSATDKSATDKPATPAASSGDGSKKNE